VRTRSNRIRRGGSEAGIALLIAIFVLLLISVVAISLIVSSGTESALAGNYRSATSVYYAALAGLEEGRGRLSNKNSTSFKSTAPGFIPSPGPLAAGQVRYIKNPLGAEDVLAVYPDTEYDQEFGGGALAAANTAGTVQTTPSVSTVTSGGTTYNGPLYKWVRINAVSEKSLNIDVDADGTANSVTPLYYDGAHFSNNPSAGPQVLELTALASLPNNSQKILQYLVTPVGMDLSFPAALTLVGGVNSFDSSFNSDFYVNGLDQQEGGTCPPASPESAKPAIGAVGTGSVNQVINGIPPYSVSPNNYRYSNYVSSAPQPTNPSVGDITSALIPALQTENSLDGPQGLVQLLSTTGLADYIVTGPATSLPDLGSPTHPVITIVRGDPSSGTNGDLTLSGTENGYGLLVVTGDLTLGGGVTWQGIILVIGQGHLYMPSYGYGKIYGAVFVARTRHSDYSLRASLGNIIFDITNPNNGNSGFYYNSCWVQAVLPSASYKVLSFHEISQ